MQTNEFAYLRVDVLCRFDFVKINTSRGSGYNVLRLVPSAEYA
jgi:hypothetical protein